MSNHRANTLNYKAAWDRQPLKPRIRNPRAQIFRDQTVLVSILVSSFFSVLYLPPSFVRIFFLCLLILFWLSKKDYLWFAFFFILIVRPGYFFAAYTSSAPNSIPLYTFLPGMSFSAVDLFVILAFVKALLNGKKTKLELEKPLFLILYYMVFSVFISIINGTTLAILANIIRGPFYYTLILSFLYLVDNREKAYSFIMLITPIVFFMLFLQVYYLVMQTEFINVFYPGFRRILLMESGELRAASRGVMLVFFSYVFSFFLLENKENKISRRYLFSIIGIAYLTVVMAAARLWFAVFTLVLVGYAIISKKGRSNMMRILVAVGIIFCVLVISGIVPLDYFTEAALPRLSAIYSVAKGDFDSDDSFYQRYSVRLPRVLEGIKRNIVFGVGFSEDYLRFRDFHVGFFNTILHFGIIGFVIFLYFFWRYFVSINSTKKKLSKNNPLKTSLDILVLAFGGILLAYFTTWYIFPLDNRGVPRSFFIALFIALTELFLKEAKSMESSLLKT